VLSTSDRRKKYVSVSVVLCTRSLWYRKGVAKEERTKGGMGQQAEDSAMDCVSTLISGRVIPARVLFSFSFRKPRWNRDSIVPVPVPVPVCTCDLKGCTCEQ
jgi:hypothetical protein